MTQPPYAPPPGGGYGQVPPPPPSNDKSVLFGVIGLVCLLCCSPATILFGWLSMNESKKAGKPHTLGLVTTILGVVALVLGIIVSAIRFANM